MKKIGILSILILCLVVGGVYATWDYAYGSAQLNQQTNVAVNLTASNVEGHKGNIVGEGKSTISIYIDDVSPKDLSPDDVSGNGKLTLKFEPATTATEEVKTKGIVMQYCVEPTFTIGEFLFGQDQVYTAVDSTWKDFNSGKPTLTVDLTGELIAACITVNKSIVLPTLEDYTNFNNAIGAKPFKVTIREKPASN